MVDEVTYRTYCAMDALATRHAADSLLAELEEFSVKEFYFRQVHPLALLVGKINATGVWADQSKREAALADLEGRVAKNQEQLNEIAGREINVVGDSIRDWLYVDLKLPKLNRKKTDKPSVDKNTLKALASRYPELEKVFDLVLEIRKFNKLTSTYIEVANETDEFGRVHPAFRIGPKTGRLACKRPPFQGYPPGVSRSIYAAPPGYLFIGADYSQVELRIFAILGKCRALLEAFAKGEDPHGANARIIYGIPESQEIDWKKDEKWKPFRVAAKRFAFGMIYGGSADTLTRAVSSAYEASGQSVSGLVVAQAMQRFFDANPEARVFMDWCQAQARTKKMMHNNFGRLRQFFGNPKDALGQAMNNPMQSGAGDLINERMIRLDRRLTIAVLLLQVHDFVLYECKEEDAEETKRIVKEEMEATCPQFGGVSFPVDISIGRNWAEV